MKVKFYTLAIFMIALMANNYAQELMVDAGNDTTICMNVGQYTPLQIGGNPTASFGEEPYTYSWKGITHILNTTVDISECLSDTSAANPFLNYCGTDTAIFFVTVTDYNGANKTDSIIIRISSFVYPLGMNWSYINQGESTTLTPLIAGGIMPLSFHWQPNYNLSDPFVEEPVASPDTTTIYNCVVSDSIGCTDTALFTVYVTPFGMETLMEKDDVFDVFPNPASIYTEFSWQILSLDGEALIEVTDMNGRVVASYTITTSNGKWVWDTRDATPGVYVYSLKGNGTLLKSGKISVLDK